MSRSVAIVGFMGAGKSSVGSRVAALLGVPFLDTDAMIEAAHGPIEAVFDGAGEARFRKIEREVALAALAEAEREARVVSLGGGAVTIGDVREALSRLAHVAWVDAPVETLVGRASGTKRPLARDTLRFRELYRERRPLYESVATVRVANDGSRPPGAVAAELVAELTAAAAGEPAASADEGA